MARVTNKKARRLNRRMAVAVASCFAAVAHANPTGPTVTSGSATFSTLGNTLNVSNVPGTIIRWQGFSIQQNEITRFLQQNSQSAVLNRVTGGNMSQLLGQLLSNGRVFLINPSGIAIGQGAVIDVAALVASSLNLSDGDFLAGRYRFTGQPGTGSIINQGTIITPAGGHVYLVAPNVENHGVITSPSGQVVLAAGKSVELVSAGSPQLRVEITAPEGEAVNLGDIVSQAGRVGIYGATVRNAGRVSANSAVVGENGKIVFKATKDVTLADGSRVEAKSSAGKGGTVEVQGDRVALTGDASIDVSGKTGGGTALIGGDYAGKNPDVQNASGTFLGSGTSIRADALESGDGGKVIVWSDEATRVHGTISARGAGGGSGGFVETSSHGYLEVTRAPELTAGGTWLLDPYNIEVVAVGTVNNDGAPTFTPNGDDSKIEAALISNQLTSGVNVVLDTGGAGSPGAQAGDITVSSMISSVASTASLTLNAASDVAINAPIQIGGFSGGGAFYVTAGGNMSVASVVNSASMKVETGGALSILGNPGQNAQLFSFTGQTVSARSILVSSQGASALLSNSGSGNQVITVAGGGTSPGIDVQTIAAGGTSRIENSAVGGAQTITVTNADHIRVAGLAGTASITSQGPQTISITGAASANRIDVGAFSANAVSQISGRMQNITAGTGLQAGGINITGSSGLATTVGIISFNQPGNSQTISTSGAINIAGGNAANVPPPPPPATGPSSTAGIFHNSNGAQTINAESITLLGGQGGNNNAVVINSTGGGVLANAGNQVINVAGALSLTGGEVGAANRATINGFAGQTIQAGSITLTSGATGFESSAGISGVTQAIHTTGDVVMNGSSSTGTFNGTRIGGLGGNPSATDLYMDVGGSLRMYGGTAANNGASIGSTAPTAPAAALPSKITIVTGNDVIMNAGSGGGTRIGTTFLAAPVAGDVSITAGGSIQMNGGAQPSAIRTAGDVTLVTLSAGSISETGDAYIAANNLALRAGAAVGGGNVALNGPNQVTTLSAPAVPVPNPPGPPLLFAGVNGNLTFNNIGALNLGETTTGAGVNLTTSGPGADLNVTNTLSSGGGAMNVNVAGALNVNGGGVRDAVMRSSGGQTITAQSVNLTAQNNRRSAIDNLNGGNQKITATAGGMNLQALGGSGVAQITNSAPGASQTLSMSGLLNVLGGTTGSPTGSRLSGVFQNAAIGTQSITSTGIILQASPNGTNPAAASGAQITAQTGSQTIDTGSGDISLFGAAGAGNNALITSLGNQTITARNISLENGTGGTNSVAAIIAPHQTITATGDVTLNSRASTLAPGQIPGVRIGGNGGATDLDLHAANVTLNGGTAPDNGAGIGSTGFGATSFDNNIRITATGNVILNAGSNTGTGVRIGTGATQPVTGGNISITAGGDIQLNGLLAPAAIRTTGEVSLTAANITEAFDGFVMADRLTLKTSGNATLSRANNVATLSAPGELGLPGIGGSLSFTNLGGLNLDSVSSGDAMTLNVGGLLTLTAGGARDVVVSSRNGQTINAQALSVTAQDGRFASLDNNGGGDQTIIISANGSPSAGIDVRTFGGGGTAQIVNNGFGGAQTVSVTDAEHIAIVAGSGGPIPGGAFIRNFNGTQTVSITGGGVNAIRIGDATSGDASDLRAQSQNVTAGLSGQEGSISIVGPNRPQSLAGIVSQPVAGGTQTVSTNGTISITGGSASQLSNFQSGILHNGSGQQTINAASISLRGGPSGVNNGGLLASFGGAGALNPGRQVINVFGDGINMAGGAAGVNNRGQIIANGDQEINGGTSANITALGDAGGNAGIFGAAGRDQTIHVANITLANSAAGGDNIAGFINGGRQRIDATGDVTLTARAADGATPGVRIGSSSGATDLVLNVGRDLVLQGGTAANNGVGIGSPGLGTAFDNQIAINAGRDVILNSGTVAGSTGARIGSSSLNGVASGNVSIVAGGDIRLNGTGSSTAIRTTGDVSLTAANMSEASNGFILANKLTLQASGNADLGGPNQVAALSANVIAPPPAPPGATLPGVGGSLNFNNNGNLNVTDTVSSGGAMTLNVAGDLSVLNATLSGSDQTIAARSVSVTSTGGFASITNQSGNQTITVAGGAGVDVNTAPGSSAAQIFSSGPGSQTITATDSDHIQINGAGGSAFILSNGTQGLSITGSGANAIRLGSDEALGSSYVGGGTNQSVVAGLPGQAGSITIVGPAASNALAAFVTNQGVGGGTQDVSTAGTISLTGGTAASQNPNGFASGIFHNRSGQQTVTAERIDIHGGASGANNSALLASFGGATGTTVGDQIVNVGSGGIHLIGGAAGTNNSAQVLTRANAKQTITTANLTVEGGAGGTNNGAFVSNLSGIGSGENAGQTINAGSIALTGGLGTGNTVAISAIGSQTISADSINLSAGPGGTNTNAGILAPTQLITTTGNVLVSGGGVTTSGGATAGARIGGLAGASFTSTNLTLNVGGDLILAGGSANGAASIGSGLTTPALANSISVNAAGDVILNSTAGGVTRIGTPLTSPDLGAGDISITAGRTIQLNGSGQAAGIRTAGNVTLEAGTGGPVSNGTITESGQALIHASELRTRSDGSTLLGGDNRVSSFFNTTNQGGPGATGNLTLNNIGALNITGIDASTTTLTNAGAMTISGPVTSGPLSVITTGAGSDLTITSGIFASGLLNFDVSGAVNLRAGAGQNFSVHSFFGQNIKARSLALTSQDGGRVQLWNTAGDQTIDISGGGAGTGVSIQALSGGGFAILSNDVSGTQTIKVAGGAGIDVSGAGGTAFVSSLGTPGAQTISVTDADHIRVGGLGGLGGFSQISAQGPQVISIKGSGGNRIEVGVAGGNSSSSISGHSQSITAGLDGQAGGIDIVGSNGLSTFVGISSSNLPGGSQTIATSGTLRIAGGNAANAAPPLPAGQPSSNAGIFHNSNGLQTISASGIEMQGGLSGNGNAVFINSSGGNVQANAGNQVINAGAGGIHVTGGAVGSSNRAFIGSSANQTINGNPDIVVTGGASGGGSGSGQANGAAILASGAGSIQTINAGAIALTSGAGGVDSFATITAPTQSIQTTGDVIMSGNSSTGTLNGVRIGGLGGAVPSATDLTMDVGGSLIMNGGSAANAGVFLGSATPTPPNPPLSSKITILAGGDVIMNSSPDASARIGSSLLAPTAASGDISITAGRSIQLNGTSQPAAIRTLDNVTLQAATTISEGANGFIQANALTTTSNGDTSLTGPNQVASFRGTSSGGSVTLNNAGPVAIQGINAAHAALIRAASVSGSGAISTGTGFTVDVLAASELNGVISGAGGLNKDGVGFLTLGAVNTYAGDTNVNVGTLALGAADQTTTGNINIAGGATFRGSPGSYTNAGVIAGNGTVDVAATSFTNSGTLRPGGAGAVGTLTVQGDAVINGTLDIEAQGAGAANHDVLAVTGAATLGGALSVTPINGYAPGSGDTIVPLTFASRSGVLNVSPADWSATYNPANLTLVFGSSTNRWIAASGNWDLPANWSLGHVPTNFETVLIDVPGSQLITLTHGTQAADRLTSFENFVIGGGSLSLGGPSTFSGSLSLLGGELKGAGNVTVNGAFLWTGGKLGGAGSFLTSAGTVSLISPLDGDLTLNRSWTNQGVANWLNLRPGAIRGSGSLRNEGTLNVAGRKAVLDVPFGNSGTLNVDADLDLKQSSQNDGTINVAGGVRLQTHGTYTNLGRLAGRGAIDLDGGKLVNLGTLAPGSNGGNGIGTFSVLGDFQQGATGVLEIDLGGTHVGQYDALDIDGKATLGGTLFMRAANGYVPRDGDDFKIVTYKSRVGTFAFLLPPAGFSVDADYGKKSATFELD